MYILGTLVTLVDDLFKSLLLLRAGFYSCDQYHRWPIDLLEKNEKFDKYKIFN